MRYVFFSFHYQRDILRVNQVRNSHVVVGKAAAGFTDGSLWERARRTSDAAVQRLIDEGLEGTSVTAVLIGAETASRRFVDYEIAQSIRRGNGLLGIHISHLWGGAHSPAGGPGAVPWRLAQGGYPIYTWRDRPEDLGAWVEDAYQRAQRAQRTAGGASRAWF